MEQAIAHIERIRSDSKCSSLFMRFEVGGILLSRCKRNSLKRRSETPSSFVVPYAGFDAINLPPSPFPFPPSLSLSLFLSPAPEHRDTKNRRSTRALDKTNARRKAPEGSERCRRVSGSVHKFPRFRSVPLP